MPSLISSFQTIWSEQKKAPHEAAPLIVDTNLSQQVLPSTQSGTDWMSSPTPRTVLQPARINPLETAMRVTSLRTMISLLCILQRAAIDRSTSDAEFKCTGSRLGSARVTSRLKRLIYNDLRPQKC
jgi:hypothetical protein